MSWKIALIGFMLIAGLPLHAQLIDEGSGAGLQCGGNSVNNTGVVVGACTNLGISVAYVAVTPGTEQVLTPLVTGRSCAADSIDNNGDIIGSCQNANGASQVVVWPGSNLLGAPTPVVANGGGVRTSLVAVDIQGYAAGVSVDSTGSGTPMLWSASNPASATVLPGGGGVLNTGPIMIPNTNCRPADVADAAATPMVIGNCPNGQGLSTPVTWTYSTSSSGGGYALKNLLLPAGAIACAASRVNVLGQVMGSCDFSNVSDAQTVWWPNATSAPIVLASIAGNVRNVGVAMNNAGQIVGNYLTGDGFVLPFFWDPNSGTVASIGAIPGGSRATIASIADNGTVIGNSEVISGDTHSFTWTLRGGISDLGTLPGGNNSSVANISRSGGEITGLSEANGEGDDAYVESLPVSSTASRNSLSPTISTHTRAISRVADQSGSGYSGSPVGSLVSESPVGSLLSGSSPVSGLL